MMKAPRLKLTREFFLPKAELNAVVAKGELSGVEAYSWTEEKNGQTLFMVKCFSRSAPKPKHYYRFNTAQRRDDYAAKFVTEAEQSAKAAAERAQVRKAEKAACDAVLDFPVGTILCHSWGWEQTNVDFYKVVGHRGRTVVQVVAINAIIAPNNSRQTVVAAMAGYCVADEKQETAGLPVIEFRQHNKDRVNVTGAENYRFGKTAGKWDGKPQYHSWYN